MIPFDSPDYLSYPSKKIIEIISRKTRKDSEYYLS